MAVITGTLVGFEIGKVAQRDDVTNGLRRVRALRKYNFAAATAGDTGIVTGIAAAVAAKLRDGRTYTLRTGVCSGPGETAAGGMVYANTVALSTNDLTCNLTTSPSTTSAAATSATVAPVEIDAFLDGTLP